MAILNDELSVWEIAYRWAGHEPRSFPLKIPLAVRDNFRLLMNAILQGELQCFTLRIEKHDPSGNAPPELYIRHHLDDVHACINGDAVPRKLLKWAAIERWAFQDWCERRGIPPPEFWFPPGWKPSFQWPGNDEDPAVSEPRQPEVEEPADRQERLRENQRARIACQQIATELWRKDPGLTITAIVEHQAVQDFGGGKRYVSEVVRRWISQVAPEEVKKRRGRPRKNPTPGT